MVQLLKLIPCHCNAAIKVSWHTLNLLNCLLDRLPFCHIVELDRLELCLFQLIEILWVETELCLEKSFRPLDAVER